MGLGIAYTYRQFVLIEQGRLVASFDEALLPEDDATATFRGAVVQTLTRP